MQPRFTFEGTRGFTLLEILIAVSILVLIAGMSMVGIQNLSRQQMYTSVVDQVRQELYAAREKTLASYDDTFYGVYVGTSTIEFFRGATPTVGSSSNVIVSYGEWSIAATSSFSNGLPYVTFARITGFASATGTIAVVDTHSHATTTFTIFGSGLIE